MTVFYRFLLSFLIVRVTRCSKSSAAVSFVFASIPNGKNYNSSKRHHPQGSTGLHDCHQKVYLCDKDRLGNRCHRASITSADTWPSAGFAGVGARRHARLKKATHCTGKPCPDSAPEEVPGRRASHLGRTTPAAKGRRPTASRLSGTAIPRFWCKYLKRTASRGTGHGWRISPQHTISSKGALSIARSSSCACGGT